LRDFGGGARSAQLAVVAALAQQALGISAAARLAISSFVGLRPRIGSSSL
jgi:hypothetical protein